MARSGRFGRLPRRAPDLSGAIVSMMQQYWNMQEQLMVDAWKNGGDVDGKPVTDERLLQFWLDRRDSMQRDDPMWDYYNNVHDQYQFSIAESKVSLSYAQHKMSARAVATWYKGQAQNYPQDSEMWRTIMGQAAKFMDAARAQASADSTKARTAAYVKIRNATYKNDIWPSSYITQGLVAVARAAGIIGGSQTQQDAEDTQGKQGGAEGLANLGPGQDLTQLGGGPGVSSGGVQYWPQLLAAINDPNDTTGLRAYFIDNFLTPAQRQGLNLTAPLDQTDIDNAFDRAISGYDKLIAIDQRYGDIAPSGEIEKLREAKVSTIDYKQFVGTLDEAAVYGQYRTALEQVLADPAATPFDIVNAYHTYLGNLDTLSQTVGSQNPVFSTALNAEKRSILGDTAGEAPTIWEGALLSPFDNSGGATGSSGDALRLSSALQQAQSTVSALQTGQAVMQKDPTTGQWTAVPIATIIQQTGGNFVIVPQTALATTITKASGTSVTPLSPGATSAAGAPTQLAPGAPGQPADFMHVGFTASQQQITYGQVYIPIPIYANAPAFHQDPNTGRYTQDTLPTSAVVGAGNTDTQIGQVVYLPDAQGNPTKAVYGIYTNGGQIRWTTVNPFVTGTTTGTGQRVPGSNGDSLIITANTSAPGVITSYDSNGNPTTDPTKIASNVFNPQSIIDGSLFAPGATASFIDPGMAAAASDDASRGSLAKADPQSLVNLYQHSPWVNWQDTTQVGEFWGDVISVRDSVNHTGLGTDLALWASLKTVRNNGQPDVWYQAIASQNPGLAQVAPQALKNIAAENISVWGNYTGPGIVSPGTIAQQGAAGATIGPGPTPGSGDLAGGFFSNPVQPQNDIINRLGTALTDWAKTQMTPQGPQGPAGYPANYQNGPFSVGQPPSTLPTGMMPGQAPAYANSPAIKAPSVVVPTSPSIGVAAPRPPTASVPPPPSPFSPILPSSIINARLGLPGATPPPPPPPPPPPGSGGNLHLPPPPDY